MKTHLLKRRQFLPLSPEELFPFFADAANLEAITPPTLRFNIVTPRPVEMHQDAVIDYKLKVRGFPVNWQTVILEWDPPHKFVDVQRKGPYRLWHHTHLFEPADGGTVMHDMVRYAIPYGPLGRLAQRLFVRNDLDKIFDYRARTVAHRFGCADDPRCLAVGEHH